MHAMAVMISLKVCQTEGNSCQVTTGIGARESGDNLVGNLAGSLLFAAIFALFSRVFMNESTHFITICSRRNQSGVS